MKKTVCYMAFAAGKESTEGSSIKRYEGVGSVFVLGVNPNKAELSKFYGTEIENDPEYISEKDGIKSIRLDFIVKTDAEKNVDSQGNGIDLVAKYSLFLRNELRYNRDKTKVQVIDKYGRTAWVATEDAKNHVIPQYSNGPANIDAGYRPAFVGEENLINFLIAYLNIPSPMKYVNGTWSMVDNPADSEAGLEKIADYFKGDVSEIKSILAFQPKNKVKLVFGVRTTDDNRQYQDFFVEHPMKNGVSDYSKVDAEIQQRKENGAYANTEFSVEPLHEYVIAASSFESNAGDNLPFDAPTDNNNPWGAAQA